MLEGNREDLLKAGDGSQGAFLLQLKGVRVVADRSDHRCHILAPRQIDRGEVKWPYMRRQKQGSTEAGPVGNEEYDSSFS